MGPNWESGWTTTDTDSAPEAAEGEAVQVKSGKGVIYLPGDISGLSKKLELLTAEFFAGNTTVRNELVYVLDALLRLKKRTKKEYTEITARL